MLPSPVVTCVTGVSDFSISPAPEISVIIRETGETVPATNAAPASQDVDECPGRAPQGKVPLSIQIVHHDEDEDFDLTMPTPSEDATVPKVPKPSPAPTVKPPPPKPPEPTVKPPPPKVPGTDSEDSHQTTETDSTVDTAPPNAAAAAAEPILKDDAACVCSSSLPVSAGPLQTKGVILFYMSALATQPMTTHGKKPEPPTTTLQPEQPKVKPKRKKRKVKVKGEA
jgi:hypothetical protein